MSERGRMSEKENELKVNEVLGFVGGVITVKMKGYAQNGDGDLCFTEVDDVNVEEDGSQWIKIQRSEWIAIRDFLNRLFPPEVTS